MIKFCCWTVFNLLLPLLICHMHGVGNFRKSLYRSHVSDPIYHPMKMVIMNYESVTNLFLKIPCHDIIYCLPLYTRIGRMQWREQANSDFFFLVIKCHFQQYVSYIMVTSFSAGRSQSTRREPPTMSKQLGNFITCSCNL